MSRRRFDGLNAVLTGSHTNSQTTLNFLAPLTYRGGTAVPTVASPDYFTLSLFDTSGVLNEVVHAVYTSGATSATVVRGREGTSGVTHADLTQVSNSPTVVDFDQFPPPRILGSQDDEFDGLSAVSWSNGPTAPTTWDIDTTVRGRGYLRSNGLGSAFASVLQAVPGAYPFTATLRVNSTRRGGSNLGFGLVLGPASPSTGSKIVWVGPNYNGGSQLWQRLAYNSWSTSSFASGATAGAFNNWDGPLWIRVIATSATSFAFYLSTDGELWTVMETGFNPGFTPGVMGVGLSENGLADLEGVVDFFRVT